MINNTNINEEEYDNLIKKAFKMNEMNYNNKSILKELTKMDGYKRDAIYKIMLHINKKMARKIYIDNKKIDRKLLVRFRNSLVTTTTKEKTLKR